MKNNRVFLDIHAIQSLPPSNINRDDTGAPKTAQYGGVQRARVSSQSWKRAMRGYFKEFGDVNNVGIRTVYIVDYIADKIQDIDENISRDDAMNKADKVLNVAGIKTKDQAARALFFLGDRQAKAMALAAIEGECDKKTLQKLLNDNPAIDIALFGRMVADDPSLNEDASAQVAHAISTHAVQTEFDFYTAVDDWNQNEHAGAGMLGTIEFNSSTLYRYANVAVHEFMRQVGSVEAVINALSLFVKAFANSLPTGKVATFANQTLPEALLVSIRTDRPVSLVSAYEEPIKSKQGYVKASVKRLLEELHKADKFLEPAQVNILLSLDQNEFNDDIYEVMTLNDLLDNVSQELKTMLTEVGD